MKTIKLITFKLMLLFLTTTLFINCESDTALDTQDEVLSVAKQAPFSSRLVYTSEIESNSIISGKLRGLTQNRNNASFENDNSAFSVDTSIAKYVEKSDGSGYSYTFAISRDNEVSTELENLVLSVNTDTQELSTVVMKYQYTPMQLQELVNTGHVSTFHETTVTPIEGDFSDLLAENNSLPCTISVTTYHITPDTGETFEYGQNSSCEHIIDPDSGETECEVYNVVSIWCPPTTTGSSGTNTTTTNNPNSSSDPSNNTTNGGTSTPPNTNDPNNDDKDEIVTTPLTKLEIQELSNQLSNLFNGNDSWTFSNDVNANNAININSVEELENIINNESIEDSDDYIDTDGIHHSVLTVRLGVFAYLRIDISQKLKAPSTNQAYELVSIQTNYSGSFTMGSEWVQNDFEAQDFSLNGDIATIDVKGNLEFLVFFKGIGGIAADFKHYRFEININTGEIITTTILD